MSGRETSNESLFEHNLYGRDPQLDRHLDAINAFHIGSSLPQQSLMPQVQLENERVNNRMLPGSTMRGDPGIPPRSQNMAWASMQGLEGSRGGSAPAGIGIQSYTSRQRQQLLPPLSLHNTVTSGMPLPEQRLDLGSLDSAQFAANHLASLNSATGNVICRTALFNQFNGQAAERNIVLTVAPTSAAPPQQPMAINGSAVDMETMPSAESQKAEGIFPSAAQAPRPSGGVVTRGLRQSARRNPPRYSDFTDDLSDTDSQEQSYDDEDEGDLDAFSEDESSRRLGLRSRGSSLQSADASQFRSAMSGSGGAGGVDSGRGGRSSYGGVAPKRPRSKTLLCEQDPEAPGLTLDQRRKIRRRINNRASARRVRQKREEELHKISAQVAKLDQEKQQLSARVVQSQSGCSQLALQLKEIRERWQMTCLTNATLHKELMGLREVWQRARGASMAAARQAPASTMGPPPAAISAAPTTAGPSQRMGGRPSFGNLASLDLASFLAN